MSKGEKEVTRTPIDLPQQCIEETRSWLVGRLRSYIFDIGICNFEPGNIAATLDDIRALDGLIGNDVPSEPVPKPLSPEAAMAEQRKAQERHEATERRKHRSERAN